MKKRHIVTMSIMLTAVLIVAGCRPSMTAEERKAFDDATAVMNYFPVSSDGSFGFSAGPYQGGTAIIGPNEMAFWVKDGKAYTVNEAAKDVAPELEPAPNTVKYDDAFIDAAHCEEDERERGLPVTPPERLARAIHALNEAKTQKERFYALNDAAKESFSLGKIEDAREFANELLTLLPKFKSNWNYGNAVQDANLVLGRIALSEGRIDDAKRCLLEAGKSPGSPQMDSFGPDMSLAKDLLEKGERQVVLDYFELCRKFWRMDNGRLDKWRQQVKDGEFPDFSMNLL